MKRFELAAIRCQWLLLEHQGGVNGNIWTITSQQVLITTKNNVCLLVGGWMDGWVDEWVGGWMGWWMDGWVGEWVVGWMGERVSR